MIAGCDMLTALDFCRTSNRHLMKNQVPALFFINLRVMLQNLNNSLRYVIHCIQCITYLVK